MKLRTRLAAYKACFAIASILAIVEVLGAGRRF
jgi:hypothetical protein